MTPPLLAQRLIEWRFGADAAESIVGDLTEEFALRAARDGASAARRWFWRQACLSSMARRRSAAPEVTSMTTNFSRLVSGMGQDLRIGFRSLRRAPVFALTAVGTLALGIGAATAIGTAATRTLLRPLPYPNGNRLAIVGSGGPAVGNVGYETALDWRARVTSFDELAVIRSWGLTLVDQSGATPVSGMRVTWNFFRMLGVRPALGRDFAATDDDPTHRFVVVLSDRFWRQHFNASPSILGTTVNFSGTNFTVIGVMPASFEPLISERYYARADAWGPLGYAVGANSSCRTCQHLKAVARLAPHATLATARAEISTVQAQLRSEHPGTYDGVEPRVESLHADIVAAMSGPLRMLAAAVALLLIIACANVAGLMMARAADRRREIALRAALGATRGRVVRQLLTESLLIGAAATVAGFALARASLQLLAAKAPVRIPRLDEAAEDPWLFVVTAGVSIGALLVFAVLPALSAARVDLESTLREGRQASGRGALRAREWLLSCEVALAILIVAGGGLMYRSVDRLLHVNPGFDPHGVLTANIGLIGPRWNDTKLIVAFQNDVIARVEALPGVASAALAGQIPLGGNYDLRSLHLEDRPSANPADDPSAERYSVTPHYFQVMRIPLLQGRLLADSDTSQSERVMVVSDTAARTLWPGEAAIGKRVRMGSATAPLITVVGVVGDVRHYSLAEPPTAQFYAPQSQITDGGFVLVVRGSGVEQRVAELRREISAVSADAPLSGAAPLDTIVDRSVSTRSFLMLLLSGFAAIALVLTGVGLYGVIAQTVAARRRELGIRVALGATGTDVISSVVSRGARLLAAGSVAGIVGAAGVGYAIRSQLYGVHPIDATTLAWALLLILGVAIVAHLGPIGTALRADARETLRD